MLTIHAQTKAEGEQEFVDRCAGKLEWFKGVDYYPNYQGVKTIGRPFVDNALSERLMLQGADGAGPYWMEIKDTVENPNNAHVYAWQIGNEFLLLNQRRVEAFNSFYGAIIPTMAEWGYRVMAGSINTGWPRLPKWDAQGPYPKDILPTVECVKEHGGLFSFHEYGWPSLWDEDRIQHAHTLRVFQTLDAMGKAAQDLDVFMGEIGYDGAVVGLPHWGWRKLWNEGRINEEGVMEQVAWLMEMYRLDGRIKGAAWFTICSWDWLEFVPTHRLLMMFADWIAAQ